MEYGTTRGGSSFRGSLPVGTSTSHLRTPGALHQLLGVLRTPAGVQLYKSAYRRNMMTKVERYAELQRRAEEDVAREVQLIRIQTPELKRVAGVDTDHDNWLIFESLSERYRESKQRAAAFESLHIRASQRLAGSMAFDDMQPDDAAYTLRDDLVQALSALSNFSSQQHVVDKTVDIVGSFIKDPCLFVTKLMNFMLVGGAGTGKTTLASAIGDVFAKAGIFVGNKLIEAGRGELVGQYEGQTVARTRNFLTANLDNGVILIDEAYAITPWHNGKPEGYGSEAATAMVEFMTRYQGLYCIIVAGYETQMVRYFLPTNEGLSRRFPNKFVLNDMSANDLVRVFQRALLRAQGLAVPDGEDHYLESTRYFTEEAWVYLTSLISGCMQGRTQFISEFDNATLRNYRNVRVFSPDLDLAYSIFENQAGSMTSLADEAITVLLRAIPFARFQKQPLTVRGCSGLLCAQSKDVMRAIVMQMIAKTSLSNASQFLAQLEQVEIRQGLDRMR